MPANLAELIEQLPATDREIEQKQAEAKPVDLSKPPPKRDRPGSGSKFTGPAPADAWKLCEPILADGKSGVVALIRLIRDPASPDFTHYKAEYLLHCLVLYVSQPGKVKSRRIFAGALASELTQETTPDYTRALLIRELEWVGESDAAPALGRLLASEALCDQAARTLLSIGGDKAIDQLRRALPAATGRTRLVLIQALAIARDSRSSRALQQAIEDGNADVRLAAAHGLARLGEASSVDRLLKLAEAPAGWERMKATAECFLLAENLTASGKKRDAARIYSSLRATRNGPKERHFREAADRALTALG